MPQLALEILPKIKQTLDNFLYPEQNNLIATLTAWPTSNWLIGLIGPSGSGKSHALTALTSSQNHYHDAATDPGLAVLDTQTWSTYLLDNLDCINAIGQARLFQLFNRLNSLNAAQMPVGLIFSAATSPQHWAMREDVTSRLSLALIYPLTRLTGDDLKLAFEQRLHALDFDLPENVQAYILKRAPRDIATLSLLINKLDTLALDRAKTPTIAWAKDVLQNLTPEEEQPPAEHVRDLVLFDLDKTLISIDSDAAWTLFLIEHGLIEAEAKQKAETFYEQYNQGALDVTAYLKFQLAFLTRFDREQLEVLRHRFCEERILPHISSRTRQLIKQHKAKNALCVVITATTGFIVEPIVRALGIEHLIATIAATEDGQFTGQVRDTPTYGVGKVNRLNVWLESMGLAWQSFAHSWFYSDSHNDLPLLHLVSNPIAVDPDAILTAHAAQHSWPIISLKSKP